MTNSKYLFCILIRFYIILSDRLPAADKKVVYNFVIRTTLESAEDYISDKGYKKVY